VRDDALDPLGREGKPDPAADRLGRIALALVLGQDRVSHLDRSLPIRCALEATGSDEERRSAVSAQRQVVEAPVRLGRVSFEPCQRVQNGIPIVELGGPRLRYFDAQRLCQSLAALELGMQMRGGCR